MKREKYEAIAVSVDTYKSTRLVISAHLIKNVSDKSVLSLLLFCILLMIVKMSQNMHIFITYINKDEIISDNKKYI